MRTVDDPTEPSDRTVPRPDSIEIIDALDPELAVIVERLDALVDRLPPTDPQPVADQIAALRASTDTTPVLQAIRVVRAAVSELQFDQVDLGAELRTLLTQMGDLKALVDPAFVVHELAQIHAVVGDRPLAERLDELAARVERLDSMGERVDRLQQAVDELPARIADQLAARLDALA